MTTAPTTQQLLNEALTAKHALLVGKRKVRVGFGTRTIEYTAATITQLDAYIAELQAIISGVTVKPVRNRLSYIQAL